MTSLVPLFILMRVHTTCCPRYLIAPALFRNTSSPDLDAPPALASIPMRVTTNLCCWRYLTAPPLCSHASPLSRTTLDTALHLAAAAGAYGSVLVLLAAGANPSATNLCGFSPGSCFLRPLGSAMPKAGMGAPGTSVAASSEVWEMRQVLRESRERLGHVRRLADANAKRLVIAAVVDQATASVHRFVEFALKVGLLLFSPNETVMTLVGDVLRPSVEVYVKASPWGIASK